MKENKNKKLENIKFIDLFAGIGAFRIAMESFGANCVFSSEWDKYAQKTYEANFGDIPEGDITKIDEKNVPDHDILCAGFPCQAFSISGKRKGFLDTRGTLFFDIIRIAKEKQPKILFLENVKNLVNHDGGKTFSIMKETLDEIGYNVFYKVLNASNFGVPQNRERIYIIAFKKDLQIKSFTFPKETNKKICIDDIKEDKKNAKKYEIKRDDIVLNKEKIKEYEKKNDCFLKPIRIGTINKGGQGERIYLSKGHAITLSAYGGGAAGKTGAYLIDGIIRKLTPRECARVQGFPDSFKIVVSDAQSYKQFGNSISVPVLKEIIKSIVNDENILKKII